MHIFSLQMLHSVESDCGGGRWTPVVQTSPLGIRQHVVWGGGTGWPVQSSTSLHVLWGSTEVFGGLVSRLLGIQWIFGEQDTDGRDSLMYGRTLTSMLWTLPHLIHCLIVELGHLVQPSHFTFQYLHTGDGFGNSSAWSCEDHLSQCHPVAALSLTLHPSGCKPQKVADLASFFDSHVQDVRCQSRNGEGTGLLCTADSPEVCLAQFWMQRWRWDNRVEWSWLCSHYSAACGVWTHHPDWAIVQEAMK